MATILETSSEPLWPAEVLERFGQHDPAPEAPPPVEWAVDARDPWIGARVFALSADFDSSRPSTSLERFQRTANVVKKTSGGYVLSCGRIAKEHHLLTLREARIEASAGVEDAPREATEFQFLGELLLEDGYVHAAEQAFARGVQLAEGSPLEQAQCRVRRGQALTLCGWFDKALDEFHEALRTDPDCAGAFLARGDGWMEWGEYETAMCDYYEVHLRRPHDPEPLVRRGRARYALGDFCAAEAELKEALQLAPGCLHAKLGLTWALLEQGRPEEALVVGGTLIAAAPTWRNPRLAKSEVLFRQGRLDEAEQESRAAGALVPSEAKTAADPWIDRAQAALARDDHAAALRFHTIAVQVAPDCEAPRAALYSTPQTNDWQAALLFESTRGPLFEPRSAIERVRRGDALRRAPGGDALHEYSEAIRLDPSCAAAYARRGALLLDEGDLDGAALDLARALRLHPKFPFALSERGRLRSLQGDEEAAALDASEARKIASEYSLNYSDSSDRRVHPRSLHQLASAWPPQRPERTAACGRRRLGMRPGRIAPDGPLENAEDDVLCSPSARSSFIRGAVRHARGDMQGAVEDYAEAALDSDYFIAACSGMGRVHLDSTVRKIDVKLGHFDAALAADPTHAPSLVDRGTGLTRKALTALRIALSHEYALPSGRDPQAAAMADGGRIEKCAEALRDFDAAIRQGTATAEVYLRRGLARRLGGDLTGALADFEESVRRDPSDDDARWHRGCAYAEAGFLNSALADLRSPFPAPSLLETRRMVRGAMRQALGDFIGAAADFDDACGGLSGAEAFRALALAQQSQGDFLKAEETLTFAVEQARHEQGIVAAWCDRGLVRLALDRPAEALADFDRVLELLPKHAASFEGRARCKRLLGDDEGALADFNEALRHDPRSATAFHHRGKIYFDRQVWDFALRDFSDAVRLDPLFANAYVDRGRVWFAKQEHYAAVRDFSEAVRHDPKHAASFEERARCKRMLGDDEGALADLNEALRLDPRSPTAFHLRGRIFFDRQVWDFALRDFSDAVRLDPLFANAYVDRGRVWFARREHDAAIRDFSEAAGLAPNDCAAFEHWASVLFELGQLQDAHQGFERAIQLGSRSAETFCGRAQIRQYIGDESGALDDYAEAIRLDPNFAESYFHRGNLRRQRRETDAAFDDYAEAVRAAPTEARYRFFYAQMLLKRGAVSAACDEFSEAARLAPEAPDFRRAADRLQAHGNRPSVRDGELAVERARRDCEQSQWSDGRLIGILAAACADLGDFDQAVEHQERAVALGAADRDVLRRYVTEKEYKKTRR